MGFVPCQVAGRLHVEVVRVSGDIGERIAGGDDSLEGCFENDQQEHKLLCMVSLPRMKLCQLRASSF